MSTKFKILPFGIQFRDEMIYMILRAKDAIGRVPRINEDLLDVNRYYYDRGDGFFLALDDADKGKVVGCGGYSRIDGTDEAFVHRLYVDPEFKHSGIGTELLRTLESEMLKKGITVSKVHLGEPKEQWREAYCFYPKHGYVEYAPRYMKKTLGGETGGEPCQEAKCDNETKEFSLVSEGFSLTLRASFYPDDIALPVNGTLNIEVKSDGFSGRSELDIDRKWFNIFVSRLDSIYRTLSGEARISEPYAEQYIHFAGDGMGHISVSGLLRPHDQGGLHELKFINSVDQTELRDFSLELTEAFDIKNAEG